ncbi:TPA: hypothetical protein J1501_003715, partial [Escherichia coli]|nr:hypothetical protein [Escherichia coli]
MKIHSGPILCASVCCLFFPAIILAAGNNYQGTDNLPHWQTPEFNNQWGLEAINAQYAYARGYNGYGINIGVLDAKLFQHPEFNGKLSQLSGHLPYDFET